jgi:chorismate mutase
MSESLAGVPARVRPPVRLTAVPDPASPIAGLREQIDQIDAALIELWQQRAELSRAVGTARVASGGARIALEREREVLDRFRDGLGPVGMQLGLLALRSGRGPL